MDDTRRDAESTASTPSDSPLSETSSTQFKGHRRPFHRPIGPGYLIAGRYRLERKIGGGGAGTVWRGHDERLRRDVAIKQVIDSDLLLAGLDEAELHTARTDALREGRHVASLRHPHIVPILDVASERNIPWLIMEYLPSLTLARTVAILGPLPLTAVFTLGAQIADALAAAHSKGLVHRDIKPGNILLGEKGPRRGEVLLTDFGLSLARGDSTSEGIAEVLVGTPAYFSPEVARGYDATPASDVYSLASTLITVATGRPPYGSGGTDDDSMADLVTRIARAELPEGALPSSLGSLAPILRDMLEPAPSRRPSAEEVRDRLCTELGGRRTLTRRLTSTVLTAERPSPESTAEQSATGESTESSAAPASDMDLPVLDEAVVVPVDPEAPLNDAPAPVIAEVPDDLSSPGGAGHDTPTPHPDAHGTISSARTAHPGSPQGPARSTARSTSGILPQPTGRSPMPIDWVVRLGIGLVLVLVLAALIVLAVS